MTDEAVSGSPAGQAPPGQIDFIAVDNSAEFQQLRRSHRSLVFPLTVVFGVWYLVYVLLGAYAHEFMAQPVLGMTNMGIVLGLGQFITTFIITGVYVAVSRKSFEPKAEALRDRLEAQVPTGGH